ncbi:LLM class F420-dependent oxidoreductase [Rhodococcus sp. NPDC127593]|uniref:LLM class F420-dependent oxidoreductase n=1 Tax=Rhodococcus sp. NPDC127593 TaxID=3345404 RepID=UPI00362CFB6F
MSLTATPVKLGTFGVWVRHTDITGAFAAEIERLGYGTLWIGGSPADDLVTAETALAATSHLAVATGIVNIWSTDADRLAQSYHRLDTAYPGRFLLGIGAGHREVNGNGAVKPYQGLVNYLDTLDENAVPAERRVLAALGPRVLALAADRTAGAHPYLVTPDHTRSARDTLGDGPLLAPEHKIAVGTDRDHTLTLGRKGLKTYLNLRMKNYLNNFRRLGFTDSDFGDGGSEALIDALVAQGTPQTIATQLREHLDAGADHVAIQPLARTADLLPTLTQLAPALDFPR